MIHVQQDDEPAVDLAHAADEVRPDARAKSRRRLNLRSGDVQHRVHGVDHDPDVLALAQPADFDDHDTGSLADRTGGLAKANQQVRDRYHRATQVDHPANRGRHHRYLCETRVLDDLLDTQNPDRKEFAAEHERQVLMGLSPIRNDMS